MSEENKGNGSEQQKGNFVKSTLPKVLYEIAVFMETLVGIFVAVALAISLIGLFLHLGVLQLGHFNTEEFHELLGTALYIVIGIEFLKTLCRHNVSSLIEVLMFAVARGLVVGHGETLENLIGIAAMAALFAIRKFLFIDGEDDCHGHGSH